MKTALAALAAGLLLSGTALAEDATTTLKVSGWHCSGCSKKTAKAVQAVKGVKEAIADSEKKTLTVTYDDTVAKPADIEKAVAALHYSIDKDTK